MSRIVSVTIHGATPDSDIDSGKVGKNLGAKLKRIKFSHPKIEMERRLQAVWPVGAAREQVPLLYGGRQNGSHVPQILTQIYLVSFVRMGKYRCLR
jgi:hypothetical protein